MLKKLGIVALVLCASVATAAPKQDIVQTAVAAGSFKTLVKAVEAAGLTGTLQSKGPFTVFAPTDQAFEKLPTGTIAELLKPQNLAQLRAILTYHVVAGRLTAAQLMHMKSVKTLEGGRLMLHTTGSGLMVNGAHVVRADIPAANGVIHVIDAVLMPPSR